MGVEPSPAVTLEELIRSRNQELRSLASNHSNRSNSSSTSSSSASSNKSSSSRDNDAAVFRARRRRHPSEVLRKKIPTKTTMKTFAQDGSFAYTGAADGDFTNTGSSSTTTGHGGQRRKRVPPPSSSLRDYESATSVLEATRRMELARQRSHVSFGKRTIDLDKTFRTAPGGRGKLMLESPPHSPKRSGRASSASFMTPAQVIFAASTGGSSYLSTNSSTGSSGSSSGGRSLSRQATLRAIAKGAASANASAMGSDDGFASTGESTSSSLSNSSSLSSSPATSAAAAATLAAKKKSKKNVSFNNNDNSSETECRHDQSGGSSSVASMLSPIHAACRKGDYLVVKHVLSFYYGNECVNLVNSSCTCGMTPLQVACDNGHVKIAKLLLRRHAQPNKRGSKKRHHSCIVMACIQKNIELVELLLQYGATVDDDALSIAASSGYEDIVRLLVNFRPKRNLSFDISAQFFKKDNNAEKHTGELDASSINKAAAVAVTQDHPEMLLILLGDGKVQASRTKVMACALDATIQSDYRLLRALAKLYDAKILLDTKDANSCTLLHHAVRNENVKSVMLLVRLGADVHARDSGSITPLYIACARGHSSIVRVLVEAGAKCVSMGPNDESPLHIAAQENHLACVEILLEHGRAPVDGLTRDHCTALHLASQRGNTQVAECLLEHGADVNALTISDETPLLKASRMSQFQTVKLLMSRGARTHPKASPSENRRGKENNANPSSSSTDEVELQFDENRNGSNASVNFSRAAHVEKQPQGGEDSIFIAKSNTHTSLKKWIRSVLKNDK